MNRAPSGSAGVLLALVATVAAAKALGAVAPFVGAPAFALLLGMLVGTWYRPRAAGKRILRFASRTVLQLAIVLLGATIGVADMAHIGLTSLPVMLGTLAAALIAAWFVGRALGVDPTVGTLVGVGTAICGASAIGAIAGIVAATEIDIAYAIATIFLFNVVAVVLYPAIGHVLSLGQQTFGIWAGTAINDTSSVVGAASAYGHVAGHVAVVTKLARTTMIIPIAVVIAARESRRRAGVSLGSVRRLFPVFLLWFVAAAALNSAGLVDARLASDLARAASLLIAVALAAIGLSTSVRDLHVRGYRPFLLGTILWAVVGVTGLLLQR